MLKLRRRAVAASRSDWAIVLAYFFLLLCVFGVGSAAQSAGSARGESPEKSSASEAAPLPAGSWRFIVSGDSRNCGDIVMPTIAAHSSQFSPRFYWHLGDLRAIYKVDEDMAFSAAVNGEFLSCAHYLKLAWPDFIDHQIAPFGQMPFYVGIGNHEVISPKDEVQFRRQFARWLDQESIHNQREKDTTSDHCRAVHPAKKQAEQGTVQSKSDSGALEPPPAYYHWSQDNVDFVYLSNASDYFGPEQLDWLACTLAEDKTASGVKSVVVGMHESLPDSFANNHSMGDSKNPKARPDGERAYKMLIEFREQTHKPVYVLSSHSHFYMENIYDTPELKKKGKPLPGWIVGTGGAERYKLPANPPPNSMKDVYGYLVGTVAADGAIQFTFQQVHEPDVPAATRGQYPATLVNWCFAHNSQNTDPDTNETSQREFTPRCVAPASAGH
jgi:hypothetical protein